jgi:hypothetical protein
MSGAVAGGMVVIIVAGIQNLAGDGIVAATVDNYNIGFIHF